MKQTDIRLEIPERNPYETPASAEQKKRLWQLGVEDRAFLDQLGNEQADYALNKLTKKPQGKGYLAFAVACALLAGSCYYAFELPAPTPGAAAPSAVPATPAAADASSSTWSESPPTAHEAAPWGAPDRSPPAGAPSAWEQARPGETATESTPELSTESGTGAEGSPATAQETAGAVTPAEVTSPAAGPAGPAVEPVDPQLPPFKHVGTSRFGVKSDQARAQLLLSDGSSRMVRIGDDIAGWTVLRVSDTYVQVEKEGRIRVIHREPDPQAPPPVDGDQPAVDEGT